MSERYDAIVVGAGVMGTAAARSLAVRGRHTLLLERFEVGHGGGSSGGPTRIFRLVYEVPDYIAMARLARACWDELEAASGQELLRVTGGIEVDRGPGVVEALAAAGVTFERLSAGEVHERWPSLRFSDRAEVVYQADGGVLRADAILREQSRLAAEAGATLMEHTAVDAIGPDGDGVRVHTSSGEDFTAPVAVLSAGPWAGALLATAGVELPLAPTLEQVSYYDLDRPQALPSVIDWGADRVTPPYLVPDPWQAGRFKIGYHHSGPGVDLAAPRPEPDPDRLARAEAYLQDHVAPHRATGVVDICLYTNTPDEDFVLDRTGPLVVVSPCSGHGFKFAPLLGDAAAALATGTAPPFPLDRFRLDRAALRGSRR